MPTRVQLFATCLVDHIFPDVAFATVRILERLGLQVDVPIHQTCCGQPAFNGGFRAEARTMARHTTRVLAQSSAPIVVPSGSCADMIVHRYPELLADDPDLAAQARDIASRTYELTQFLVDVMGVTDLGVASAGAIAYHASCHTLRGIGARAAPLTLLRHVKGGGCREVAASETCCGFGGVFSVKMPEISAAMLDEKLDRIEASGAGTIVATDVSCLMHIGGGLRRRGSPVRVAHVAEVLDGRPPAPGQVSLRDGQRVDTPDPRDGTSGFRFRARRALDDHTLRGALAFTTGRLFDARSAAMAALPEAGALRVEARRIRARTLSKLDVYLAQFAEAAERAGAHVHWAATAAEANELVVDLARKRGARLAVKSKSMVSEEIELNDALAAAGIRVVETDLGEYVVQLGEDRPSHIITPIIHKTRDEVGVLLREKLHASEQDVADIPAMTALARRTLRREFLEADIGISGANFLVAETGSVVVVTNEGNGRMCTGLPRAHIVVAGIERVVPDVADLGIVLQLLARSATGQKLTAYTNVITGPRRTGEGDGPDELHIVLVDNGRSRILGGPLAEILYCIRCGACLNACPVYRHVGGHAYGSVYPGPMGAVLTPGLHGIDGWEDLPHASSLCGACREVCPIDIDLPRMLLELRADTVAARHAPWWLRLGMRGYAMAAVRPWLYRLGATAASRLTRELGTDGWVRRLPGPLHAWTDARDFPAFASPSFCETWWHDSRKARRHDHEA